MSHEKVSSFFQSAFLLYRPRAVATGVRYATLIASNFARYSTLPLPVSEYSSKVESDPAIE